MKQVPAWLLPAWDGLLRRKAQHALPHALLLAGAKGVGKYEFSLAFAGQLLCQTQQACGTCHACVLFSCGHHPDLFLLAPQEHGQIKIDQVRSVIERLTQTAQQGGYRVVIIQEAHAMNVASSNALLKTLEEPGAQTVLMLLTDREALLPATLRSRCQTIKLYAQEAPALAWLTELGLSPQQAHDFFTLSEGAPYTALQLSQSDYHALREKLIIKIKKAISNEISVVTAAADLLDKPLDETLCLFQTIIMDLIRSKTLMKQDEALQALTEKFTLAKLFGCYDAIISLRKQINAHLNLNATLLLENLFLTVCPD